MTHSNDLSESPLTEALPASLEDYFNKDPLDLTRQDRDTIVAYYRRARESFLKGEAAGKRPGRTASKAPPKVALPDNFQLNLDDLDV